METQGANDGGNRTINNPDDSNREVSDEAKEEAKKKLEQMGKE